MRLAVLACAALALAAPALAQEAFLGEIRQVGFNFAPRGWMFCQGKRTAWC